MIYTIHDSKYKTYLSRGDGFFRQLMAVTQHIEPMRFAPIGMEDFVDGDIVLIYLDNKNPYGKYIIPDGVKKVFICGKLDKNNIEFLRDADHIIYLNEFQQRAAENYGITNKSLTIPHHPLPTIDISPTKTDRVFIGGLFDVNHRRDLSNDLINLHDKYQLDTRFIIVGGGQGPAFGQYIQTLTDELNKSKLNGSRVVSVELTKYYSPIYMMSIANSETVYLRRSEPTVAEARELLDSKDNSILDYPIGDSSTMTIAHKYGCNIDADDRMSFAAYHEGRLTNYSFNELVTDIVNISSII